MEWRNWSQTLLKCLYGKTFVPWSVQSPPQWSVPLPCFLLNLKKLHAALLIHNVLLQPTPSWTINQTKHQEKPLGLNRCTHFFHALIHLLYSSQGRNKASCNLVGTLLCARPWLSNVERSIKHLRLMRDMQCCFQGGWSFKAYEVDLV